MSVTIKLEEKAEFLVNDYVVYPAHGVGQITELKEETVAGMVISLYIITFVKDKMVLSVPVKRAKKVGLRRLSNSAEIESSLEVLRGRARPSKGMWSRRAQVYEEKINSGCVLAIAEVVRDLHKNIDDPDRSYSERMIYESALDRLCGEVAAVHKLDPKLAVEVLLKALRNEDGKAEAA